MSEIGGVTTESGDVPTGGDAATPQRTSRSKRERLVSLTTSAGGVYGLIVISGIVVVSRNFTARSVDGLLVVLGTLLVLFVAHSYALTVAQLAPGRREVTLREAIRRGVTESAGMLVVGLVPAAVLLLGVVGLMRPSDAVWLALLVDVALLALLGWGITAGRTRSGWARLGGALVTAALGGVIILLKVLIHH